MMLCLERPSRGHMSIPTLVRRNAPSWSECTKFIQVIEEGRGREKELGVEAAEALGLGDALHSEGQRRRPEIDPLCLGAVPDLIERRGHDLF